VTIKFIKKNDRLSILKSGVELSTTKKCGGSYDALDMTDELGEQLLYCDATEIPTDFSCGFDLHITEFDNIDFIVLAREGEFVEIDISIAFIWENWNIPIVIGEFLELYNDELEAAGFITNINGEKNEDRVSVSSIIYADKGSLIDHIKTNSLKAKEIHDQLLVKITKENSHNSLVKIFNFPPEYEVICSQYVLWFGELLNSLNIKAKVSTEVIAGKMSLIVSPHEAPELLGEIEKILYQYLALPYSEYLPRETSTTSSIDRAIFQTLTNQVENFKLQMQMKDSIIQLKDTTISNLLNENQNKNSELLLLRSVKQDDELKALNGAISIGELKWGAIKIDFKKIADIFTKNS